MENELLQNSVSSMFEDRSIAAPMLRSQVAGYRAIWISDLHLGTRRCRAGALLDFLRNHYAETLFLVGDIVDGWNSGRSWYWDNTQAAVVDQIRFWQGLGSRVVFLPGNHDEFSGSLVDSMFRPDSTHDQLIHVTAEGRRMLTLHGHQFHPILNPTRLLSMMGSETCAMAARINDWFENKHHGRREHRNGPVSAYFKRRVKRAADFLSDIDDKAVLEAALRNRVDGVICGHIHRPEERMIDSILYVNDGDWVENRSALAEHPSGELELLRWQPEQGQISELQPQELLS